MKSRTKTIFITATLSLIISAIVLYRLFIPGVPFLITYVNNTIDPGSFERKTHIIKVNDRDIMAYAYVPKNIRGRTLLLVHGVHYDGIDEQRLVRLAKLLAQAGHIVFTPDIKDLRDYSLVERALDDMKASALWLLNQSDYVAPGEKIGLWGISFSGGLGMALAVTDQIRHRISGVFSFGGHADLDETLHFLMTGDIPGDYDIKPHVYGQAVLVRRYADKLVPAEQTETLRHAIKHYLHAEYDEMKKLRGTMATESKALLDLCRHNAVDKLGEILNTAVHKPQTVRRMSPAKLPPPSFPVFLLHGSGDNVIPPSELHRFVSWAERGDCEIHALETGLMRHVDLDGKKQIRDVIPYLEMVRFWNELLRN